MKTMLLITDHHGNPLGVCSSEAVFNGYLKDLEKETEYAKRKVQLERLRRESNIKANIVQPRYNGKSYNSDISEIKSIIAKKPHLKDSLQPEIDRLDGLVREEKANKAAFFADYENRKRLRLKPASPLVLMTMRSLTLSLDT